MKKIFELDEKQQESVLAPSGFSITGNRKMTTYNGLSISDTCKCSMPCQHWVVLPSGEEKMMRGDKIYKIISKNHPKYNHFKQYGKWIADIPIRKLKYELAEIQSKKEWEKIYEKRRQEEEASNYNKPEKFVQPEFCIKRNNAQV